MLRVTPFFKDTAAILYTTRVRGCYRREALAIFQQEMPEWRRKEHLEIENGKDYIARELVDWYLTLPRTLQLKTDRLIRQDRRRLKRKQKGQKGGKP